MFFTWRFVIGCFFYTLLFALFPNQPLIGYGLILFVLLGLLDGWLTLREPPLVVRRILPGSVYRFASFPVQLEIVNPGRFPKTVTLKDEPPFELHVAKPGNEQRTMIAPGATELISSYQVIAIKRGLFQFGNVNIKFSGRLGLFNQTVRIVGKQSIKVLPDLVKIFSEGLARPIGAEFEGFQRRRIFGVGGEFAQLREFVAGDDIRKINWKVTAHMRKPIVNQFEPEKAQNVFLIFDTGRLLYDQIDETTSRLDFILDSAILLAYNILQAGDLVGALSFANEVQRFLAPGKGVKHLQLFVEQFYALTSQMVESDYREAFQFWSYRANKRSLLFVYTDLVDPESSRELIGQLKILRRNHIVVCVLLQQPGYERIANETIHDEMTAFRKGIAFELFSARERLKQLLRNEGIRIIETTTEDIHQVVVEHYRFLKSQGMF